MVEKSFAWHFKKYSYFPIFLKIKISAKSIKKRLWAQKNTTLS
jgi:hypothetical protein